MCELYEVMSSYSVKVNSVLVIKGDVRSSLWLNVGSTMCVLYDKGLNAFQHWQWIVSPYEKCIVLSAIVVGCSYAGE